MEKIWLKSYANGVPAEIIFEKITLSEALTRTAERYPQQSGSPVPGHYHIIPQTG